MENYMLYDGKYEVYDYTDNGDPDVHIDVLKFYKDVVFENRAELTEIKSNYNKKSQWRLLLKEDIHDKHIEEKVIVGGDAIISIATVIGCVLRTTPFYEYLDKIGGKLSDLPNKVKIAKIIEQGVLQSDAECNLIKLFYLYHTKGNFMPLPRTGINSFKNTAFHDFPDQFFKYVRDSYFINSKNDENNVYFSSFGSWENFIKQNRLQEYFNDEELFVDFKKISCYDDNTTFDLKYNEKVCPKRTLSDQYDELR
ncbi:MAG: hypothetical protein LBM93_00145 [Oscillospiraceae bacterium]|jgi:hypothetical protein|nr:hypothetical protein [Oscillospiraceae bacterium]